MNDQIVSESSSEEPALLSLFQMIAARDQQAIAALLAASPSLARAALNVGATRDDERTYFLQQIGHYTYKGDTPLHIAAASYQPDIAKQLLARGAHVQVRNRRGAVPLHYAADGAPGSTFWNPDAQKSMVEFLLAAGADSNGVDLLGVTPLHRAVRTRCAPAVRALLENGADPLRKNKSGSTPLHLAVQNTGRGGTGTAISQEQQKEIIHLLLSHGARPSDTNSAGKMVKDYVKSEWIRAALRQP